MRVLCRHGHYAFYPEFSTELSAFVRYFETPLIRERGRDFFTFEALAGLPGYSVKDATYSGLLAMSNFGGELWEVMEANETVYSLGLGRLVYRSTITARVELLNFGDFFSASVPLIQAGSILSSGARIVDYMGFFIDDYRELRLSEVGFD